MKKTDIISNLSQRYKYSNLEIKAYTLSCPNGHYLEI
jgi:hypothetical protein